MATKNGYALDTGIGYVFKFQIRLHSIDPTPMDVTEEIEVFQGDDAKVTDRLRVMLNRASYMHDKPNRHVWWAVDQWHYGYERWECIANGKSRLREGSRPI